MPSPPRVVSFLFGVPCAREAAQRREVCSGGEGRRAVALWTPQHRNRGTWGLLQNHMTFQVNMKQTHQQTPKTIYKTKVSVVKKGEQNRDARGLVGGAVPT